MQLSPSVDILTKLAYYWSNDDGTEL